MKPFITLNTDKRGLAPYCVVFPSTSLLLTCPLRPDWGQDLIHRRGFLILLKNFSPRSSAEVKNEWGFSCPPSLCIHGVDRNNLTFLLYLSTEGTNVTGSLPPYERIQKRQIPTFECLVYLTIHK